MCAARFLWRLNALPAFSCASWSKKRWSMVNIYREEIRGNTRTVISVASVKKRTILWKFKDWRKKNIYKKIPYWRMYEKILKNISRENTRRCSWFVSDPRLEKQVKKLLFNFIPSFPPFTMNHVVTKDTISSPYETIAQSRVNQSSNSLNLFARKRLNHLESRWNDSHC